MNEFDKYLRNKAKEEQIKIPDFIEKRIERTLVCLPEKENRIYRIPVLSRIVAAAACVLFIMLFLLPNVSVSYAKALEKVPVLGDIVRVVTIRNYVYSDGRHEMNIDVPQIEDDANEAADYINKDVAALTDVLVEQFYKDLEEYGSDGYGSIQVDYETVTDSPRWFTLKVLVSETAASSDNYFKFYHIDKQSGKIVELADLFDTDSFSDVLTEEIKKQMQERMKADETVVYWIDDCEIGEEFTSVRKNHNFYWNGDGDLVIVFDKYEVAPGSMGTPEFVIGKDIIKDILKEEFENMVP